MIKEADNIKN